MGSNLDHRESFPCWEVHTINILYVYLDQSSQVALVVENLPANAGHVEDRGSIPESGRSPGGGQANPWTAWEIPWTEEPGGLWSIGSQRDTTEANLAHTHI